jgi:hypothetical protein
MKTSSQHRQQADANAVNISGVSDIRCAIYCAKRATLQRPKCTLMTGRGFDSNTSLGRASENSHGVLLITHWPHNNNESSVRLLQSWTNLKQQITNAKHYTGRIKAAQPFKFDLYWDGRALHGHRLCAHHCCFLSKLFPTLHLPSFAWKLSRSTRALLGRNRPVI